jgi:hypothetical protein
MLTTCKASSTDPRSFTEISSHIQSPLLRVDRRKRWSDGDFLNHHHIWNFGELLAWVLPIAIVDVWLPVLLTAQPTTIDPTAHTATSKIAVVQHEKTHRFNYAFHLSFLVRSLQDGKTRGSETGDGDGICTGKSVNQAGFGDESVRSSQEAHQSVCRLLDSTVLSHSTISLVLELKVRLEHQIAVPEAGAAKKAPPSHIAYFSLFPTICLKLIVTQKSPLDS